MRIGIKKFTKENKSIFILCFVSIVLSAVLVNVYFNIQKVKSSADWVEHTLEVLHKSDNVLINILTVETGSRGYLLTGNNSFLMSFDNSVAAINVNLSDLKTLTKDNPGQQYRVNCLKSSVEDGINFTNKVIEVRMMTGLLKTEKIISNEKGEIIYAKVRSIINDINFEELRLFQIRKHENESNNQYSEWIFISLLVVIITLAISIVKIQKIRNKYTEGLKKSEEQLSAVNKELETFTYSVSHDLRAPLRAINGYAKILQDEHGAIMDSDGINSLNAILKNSKKMGELIDDLLAFSRLGRKIVPTSEINMEALLNSVMDEEIAKNPNKIDFEIHDILPAMGQQALIKQVWVNLLSNAIKYSQHKPQTKIEVGSYYKNNLVVYYVKDNGVGFDMQYYNKLFGVFQRLHSQEEFEGTGIGLAIVQKIVQRHNGSVWAESKLNEGTSFYFTLPKINS